jgi:hypothetical protein
MAQPPSDFPTHLLLFAPERLLVLHIPKGGSVAPVELVGIQRLEIYPIQNTESVPEPPIHRSDEIMSEVIIPRYDGRIKRPYELYPIKNIVGDIPSFGYRFTITINYGYVWVTNFHALVGNWYVKEALGKINGTNRAYTHVVGASEHSLDIYVFAEALGTYPNLLDFLHAAQL